MSLYSDAAAFIARFEGFRDFAYWDVNHYRIGFGSDTRTAKQIPVKRGDIESRADALANLELRIHRFIDVIVGQIGQMHWGELPPNEQIALIDVCYNYGSLPHSLVWACLYSDKAAVARAIINHEHDNHGINESRRSAEAALIRQA